MSADIYPFIQRLRGAHSAFGRHAEFTHGFLLQGYKAEGINYVAPPMWELLTAAGGDIVPSQYALDAKAAGLKLIAWTLERSGRLADSDHGGWYYQSINGVVNREGDILRTLDVLAKDVGIVGIFSDWPATVTFYANCMGL